MDPRTSIGRLGEDAALTAYEARGYRLLARNWRCSAGELDLVVEAPDGVLVVCEVKARRGAAFGGGYEAMTVEKRRRVRRLAELFVATTRPETAAVRLDVASVHVRRDGRADVQLFEDAF